METVHWSGCDDELVYDNQVTKKIEFCFAEPEYLPRGFY